VALDTGLRKSDLLDLRWGQIDFLGQVIRRVQSKTRREVTSVLSDAAGRAILEVAGPFGLAQRKPQDRVFEGYDWGRVTRNWKLALKLAEITRRVLWHDLRHTFGSDLAAAGVPIIAIRDAMGHASLRSTERYARPGAAGLDAVRAGLRKRGQLDTYESTAKVSTSHKEETPAIPVKRLQGSKFNGAGHEGRTRDIYLGKVALYH